MSLGIFRKKRKARKDNKKLHSNEPDVPIRQFRSNVHHYAKDDYIQMIKFDDNCNDNITGDDQPLHPDSQPKNTRKDVAITPTTQLFNTISSESSECKVGLHSGHGVTAISINFNESYFGDKKDSDHDIPPILMHMEREKQKTVLQNLRHENLLQQACQLYWQQIKSRSDTTQSILASISIAEDEKTDVTSGHVTSPHGVSSRNNKNINVGRQDSVVPFEDEKDPLTMLMLVGNGNGNGNNNNNGWKWAVCFGNMINRESNWKGMYEIIEKNFSLQFIKNKNDNNENTRHLRNEFHSCQTLASNECLDFLWRYVAYCYYQTKTAKYTLGSVNAMLNLLIKTNNLFRAIMIAYDFEFSRFSKYLNHYLKFYLKHINKDILGKIEQIKIRVINPNCYAKGKTIERFSPYFALKKEFEKLQFRMEACRVQLKDNDIHTIKL